MGLLKRFQEPFLRLTQNGRQSIREYHMNKITAQTLITKLDLSLITPKEAKEYAKRWHGIELPGRTKEQIIKSINAAGCAL